MKQPMKRWFVCAGLSVAALASSVQVEAQEVRCEASEVGRQFAAAADKRDVAALEGLLHPEFSVVFRVASGEGEASVLSRAVYLGLLKEGKLGGAPRRFAASGVRWGDKHLALVGATLEGASGRFESVYTVVRHEGRCKLLQDATLFTPPAAPGGGKQGAVTPSERSVQGASMEARWVVESGVLRGEMRAPTQGWVLVGLSPRPGLAGSLLIFGAVRGGEVVVEEHIASPPSHRRREELGGVRAASAVSGEQSAGWTRVAFELRLSEDGVGPRLVEGEAVYVTLAWSREDDFSHHSAERVEVSAVL